MSFTINPYTPTQVAGDACTLWLDAADRTTVTGNPVTAWTDKSGRGFNASATVGPTLGTFGGLPVLSFNGINQRLTSNNTVPRNTHTLIMVNRPALLNGTNQGNTSLFRYQISSGYVVFPYMNGTTPRGYITSADGTGVGSIDFQNSNLVENSSTSTLSIIFAVIQSGSQEIFRNGTRQSSNTLALATGTSDTLTIGAFGVSSEPYQGDLAEMIVYNRALNTQERQQLEAYLAWKWNLVAYMSTGNPYLNAPYLLPKPFDFVPSQLSGLSLWIDAADPSSYTLSGSTVVAVRDKSPLGIPLGTATNWNYITTFNTSFPGFQFVITPPGSLNPSGKLGSGAIFPSSTPFTVFIVVHANLTTQAGFVLDSIDATGTPRPFIWLLSLSTTFAGFPINYAQNPTIATFGYVAGTGTAYQYPNGNTSLQVTGNLASGSGNGISIGNRGTNDQGWPGIIAEILLYSGNMGLSDRQKVEGYLAAKWGLRGNLPTTHPFKSVSPEGTNPFAIVDPAFYTPFMRQSFFNPLIITGCILWWDASDPNVFAGDSTWIDKSGTGNNGITTSVAGNSLPTLGTWPNGNRAAVFTRTGNTTGTSIMTNSATNPALNYTMFIVMSITGLAPTSDPLGTEQFIFINNLDGARQIKTNTSSTAGFPATLTVHFTNASSINLTPTIGQNQGFLLTYVVPTAGGALGNVFLNGATPQTQTTLASGVSRFYFGSANNSANRYFTGQIGEILIYNSVLSNLDRQRIEGYLAWKWGIPGNLPQTHPFKLFAPPESSPDGPPPVPPPPPFSGWSIVLDGADASVVNNGGGSFTCNGPNDSGGTGWAYIYGFFSTAGSITYNYNWFTSDGIFYDWPFEFVTSNDPSNPGNVNFNTKIASGNSESGSRTVSYGANQYVVLGVYSVDSIFGNGVCTFSGLPT